MNYIAAYLLSQIRSPELSFWTFVSILQTTKGLFHEGIPLLKSSLELFDVLLKRNLPTLHAHFVREVHSSILVTNVSPKARQRFNIAPIVAQWCSTLFCCPGFPFKFSLHVMDTFLLKGYEMILRIGLSLFTEAQGAYCLHLEWPFN